MPVHQSFLFFREVGLSYPITITRGNRVRRFFRCTQRSGAFPSTVTIPRHATVGHSGFEGVLDPSIRYTFVFLWLDGRANRRRVWRAIDGWMDNEWVAGE